MFWEYSIRKQKAEDEDRQWDKFGRHMGTVWHRSDFEEGKGGTKRKDPDVLFYPHAMLVSQNNLYKQIKTDFESGKPRIADYRPEAGEEIVETSDLSYEDFKEFYDQFSVGLATGAR